MPNGIGRLGLLLALSFAAIHAHAAELGCGVYQDKQGEGYRLVIDNGAEARMLSPDGAPNRYQYRREGAVLKMADLDDAYVVDFEVDADSRILGENGQPVYSLAEPAACKPLPPAPAAGTCRADLPR